MPVDSVHPEYSAYKAIWKRCRDFFQGSDTVKAAGETYLPRLGGQDPTEYSAYLNRALFYNATARTVEGLVGMIFRKDPTIEFPAAIAEQLDRITADGVPLTLFAKEATREVMITGRYGVLVDMPERPSKEARPYLIAYNAESIVNWKTMVRDGVTTLSMVVLYEEISEPNPEDPFTDNKIAQYRVLGLDGEGKYFTQIWRLADPDRTDSWAPVSTTYPMKRGEYLTTIPFVFLGPNVTVEVDKPPIADLVDVNLSHYQSSADLEHGRHFTALPTVWLAGFDASLNLKIGSTAAWVTNRPEAKCGMLEFTGQGLGALEKALAEKEEKMAALGARMLEKQKSDSEAAETVRLRQSGEQSTLQAMANSISIGLTQALQWYVEWAAVGGTAAIALNTQFFEAGIDPQRLQQLMAAWQGGAISKETLYYNMQKGGITRPDVTFEQEQQAILSEMPKGYDEPEEPPEEPSEEE